MCFSVNSTLFANVLTYPETPKLSVCPSQNTLPLSARKSHKDATDGFRKLQTLKSLRAPAIAVSLPKDHLTGWTATWWCTLPCQSLDQVAGHNLCSKNTHFCNFHCLPNLLRPLVVYRIFTTLFHFWSCWSSGPKGKQTGKNTSKPPETLRITFHKKVKSMSHREMSRSGVLLVECTNRRQSPSTSSRSFSMKGASSTALFG